MTEERVTRLLEMMNLEQIDQLLVSDPAAIFYLTGKWIHPGERLLVLLIDRAGTHKLFINELFPVYEDFGVEKVWFKDIDDSVQLVANALSGSRIGIDKNWPAKFLLKLMEYAPNMKYLNGSLLIDRIRANKDEAEKAKMRVASLMNDQAMGEMIALVKNRGTEVEMSGALADIYKGVGADGFSFGPIVAFGKNAADPHHEPDETPLCEGDSIIIDIGCKKDSYCADMTRTVFYKSVSEKAREVYETVLEANRLAIAAVKPGARFCDVDLAARNHIESKGYGPYFTHRTGHSIGIEVHDFGDVSSVNTDLLEVGMIFSIEPGIYLTGEVGVRIEDLVLVTETGCEVLNKFEKDLIIVE